MNRQLFLLLISVALVAAGCAGGPSSATRAPQAKGGGKGADWAALRVKLDEVKAGDFGEFMTELRQAELELDRAEAIYAALRAGRGGNPAEAEIAVQRAVSHRDKAEAALQRSRPEIAEEKLDEYEQRLSYVESLHVAEGTSPPVTSVYFGFGSSRVQEKERAKLMELIEFLREHPLFALKVEGYADSVGNKAENQRLAERRNQAVVQALRREGLPIGTLVTIAVGPVNGSTQTRNPQNRRVEIKPYVHGRYIAPEGNGFPQAEPES